MVIHWTTANTPFLQFTVGKERLLECFALEASRQTGILIVEHIIVHTDSVVVVHITFLHHLVSISQQLYNTSSIPKVDVKWKTIEKTKIKKELEYCS